MSETDYFVHESACVDQPCRIGPGTKIWHFSHVMKDARIGRNCVLGQNVHVAGGAVIGDNVKVQNNVSIYSGVLVEDDVFLGPSCVLTNVTNPRSQVNRHALYEKTVIGRGATVAANATVLCGITLGRYCFIAAGAVVTADVPDYAMMMGVPGRQAGWVSRHGIRLPEPNSQGIMVCPESGYRYRRVEPNHVRCLDLDEDKPLPADKAVGRIPYAELTSEWWLRQLQLCFEHLGYRQRDLPEAEEVAREVLAIPVYPEPTDRMKDYAIEAILDFLD